MKRTVAIFLITCLASWVSGQKSRVLAVFQMVEQGKYTEAKEAIELATWNDKTSRWPRTYYAKGLLCQTAYEEGYKSKDTKKTNLYPDQLYLAHKAYERALELDARERLRNPITQKYYYLSNDFRQLGEDHFNKKEYEEALRAFEHALLVNHSPLINAAVDTNLVYNAALSAFESENWEKAVGYLTGLHEDAHAPETTILLYQAHMKTGDTVRAEEVLLEGAELYDYSSQVVIHLINLFDRTDRLDQALSVVDNAIDFNPDNYLFLWSRGLILQRKEKFQEAIESLRAAIELAPEQHKIYYHLGVIYYNVGIDMREASLRIKEIDAYQEVRKQSREQFLESLKWLEQAFEMEPSDEETISKLNQLYYQLQMKEKGKSMKELIE